MMRILTGGMNHESNSLSPIITGRALGINAADYCLVAVKLGYLEPCFRKIAKQAIMATTKGCSNEVLETIPYMKVQRPIYPLDKDMEWSPC